VDTDIMTNLKLPTVHWDCGIDRATDIRDCSNADVVYIGALTSRQNDGPEIWM